MHDVRVRAVCNLISIRSNCYTYHIHTIITDSVINSDFSILLKFFSSFRSLATHHPNYLSISFRAQLSSIYCQYHFTADQNRVKGIFFTKWNDIMYDYKTKSFSDNETRRNKRFSWKHRWFEWRFGKQIRCSMECCLICVKYINIFPWKIQLGLLSIFWWMKKQLTFRERINGIGGRVKWFLHIIFVAATMRCTKMWCTSCLVLVVHIVSHTVVIFFIVFCFGGVFAGRLTVIFASKLLTKYKTKWKSIQMPSNVFKTNISDPWTRRKGCKIFSSDEHEVPLKLRTHFIHDHLRPSHLCVLFRPPSRYGSVFVKRIRNMAN